MKHSLNHWFTATRPWSFPASAMPALVAISYIFFSSKTSVFLVETNWIHGILALIGAVIFQAAGNLIGDYFDFINHVDRKESFGSSKMLVDGVFKPKTILNFGLVLLAIGSLMGIYLVFESAWDLLFIGFFGFFGTFFYYIFKFRALGDLLIFIIYGPLIALGTALVITIQLNYNVLLLSIPIGFLVVNILHANNTRDIKHDRQANIKTLAMLMGIKGSRIYYDTLAIGSYIAVILMVIFKVLNPICLAVVLTFPLALKNIKIMRKADIEKPELIQNLDALSAQLVLIFSLVLAICNFIAGLI